MKVIDKTLSDDETSSTIDLFEGRKLTKEQKKEIQEQVGQFIVEETALAISKLQSPIEGGEFKKTLSPNYKKFKLEEVGSGVPNLEFSGEMLDTLDFKPVSEGIKIGVFGDRALAADGHNNLSGKSQLPQRKFLPDTGEEYKSNIKKEVDRIVADVISETINFKDNDFKDITTSKELYDELGKIFGGLSKAELELAVLRNENLHDLLTDLDLLDLL